MAVVAVLSKDLAFSVPTVAARVYMTKGPSGWMETFKRIELDAELAAFLKPVGISEVVELFVLAREVADKPEPTNWHTVIGFLARTMNVSPKLVPHRVGIAFWGQVVIVSTA